MIASQNARLEVVQALLTNWAVVNAKENGSIIYTRTRASRLANEQDRSNTPFSL
jgi:hypothetical protein